MWLQAIPLNVVKRPATRSSCSLNHHAVRFKVGIGSEGCVQAAISGEAGNPADGVAGQVGEKVAHQNVAVAL